MKKRTLYILLTLTLLLVVMFISCDHKTRAWDTLDTAENLMCSRPDSALAILSTIDKGGLGDDEEKARYALLMSMALDKNYIDTTSFDVLQPAIDYYLHKGSADERLRTLYYQGRIFLNRSDFDMAMQTFLKANDLKNRCKDTLTYANMLVAQSILNFFSYQLEDYVSNNLTAAYLYERLNNDSYRQSSLIKALDGSIALGNRQLSDSILSVVDSLSVIVPESCEERALVRQTYSIAFEPKDIIASMLDTIPDYALISDASKLNIANGYLKLKQYKKADSVLMRIDPNSETGESFRYLQIRPVILEANGKYKEALAAYSTYVDAIDKEDAKIFYQKTKVAQELHELKVNHIYSLQQKDKQIWLGLCVVLVLIIIIGIIYYQLRLGKKNRIISEQEQSRLQLENENLQKQNSVLELEKYNAQLECEKQNLAAENMRLKISQLELESEHLKELLSAAELSKPILDSIQERIGILNGLLAAKISDNQTYSKPYDKWINQITEDRKSFMDSTRLAFRASHPALMKYLDDHGLTEAELNYVCLYAIGLRGKEIGEYIQLKRHYHTSTDIRKKLGLNEDDTNLGLHIRNLMKKL
ncbi:hypothetical protein [uncultured Muribaculum sp.]|uniref:hypothetical protein n=1 Tax=uncultured Muribaculum sp. TaxID=1918613 RepID=UPI00272E9FA5|nr:hypothetical protein [uncultured Muribaculum sp.]